MDGNNYLHNYTDSCIVRNEVTEILANIPLRKTWHGSARQLALSGHLSFWV